MRWITAAIVLVLSAAASAQERPDPNAPPPDGPWNHRLHFATSADGLSFQESPTPILAGAGQGDVLELVRDLPEKGEGAAAGTLVVYAVDARNAKGPGSEKLDRFVSTDGGKTWGLPSRVTIHWAKKPTGVEVELSVVQKPDGSLRMYFIHRAEGAKPAPRGPRARPLPRTNLPISRPRVERPAEGNPKATKVYSAVSEDGLSFTVEDSYRFEEEGISDPEVLWVGEEWLMFLSSGDEVRLATSSDGLRFEASERFQLTRGGVPGAALLADGRVRIYQSVPSGVNSVVYDPASGRVEAEEGSRFAGPCMDPAVWMRREGGFVAVISRPLKP
ncbi:MAG: hypothetical protein WD749_03590 [Phycisphaerales bacterium]